MTEAGESQIYGPFESNEIDAIQMLQAISASAPAPVDTQFDLDELDIFVDETSPLLHHLSKCEESVIGMEQIVDDQTNENIKCVLCRIIIKDRHSIIDHLKDVQHQCLYLEKFHPLVYNCLTSRHETAEKFCELINRYSVELVLEQGRKQCRTHVKGSKKGITDSASKQKKSSKRESSSPKSRRSDSSKRDSRHRSRSRSPHHKKNHDRHYRRHHDSPSRHDHDRKSNGSPTGSSKKYQLEEEDLYGHMPEDAEVTKTLLSSKLMDFGCDEAAFVQSEIDHLKRSVVGLGFIAEYSDPAGIYKPGYLCALCEGRFSPAQIRVHITTDKHRMKYMERRYKTYHATVTMKTLPEDTRKDLISRYCRDIEKKEGRGVIKRKIIIDQNDRSVFRHHTPLALSANYSRKRHYPREEYPTTKVSQEPVKVEVVDRQAVPVPPKIQAAPARVSLPQRPDFIYSEKKEKEKLIVEVEKLLPPFVERNLESGWYSIRQFSWDYYQRLVPPLTPYVSVRCPHAVRDIYGTWSPFVMRRLQDQFNFSLDHLTWLQKLLLDWRMPLSKPLEPDELRPLADDVEEAVLKSMLGQTLQQSNFFERIHNRAVFEYDDRPTEETVVKPAIETIEYDTGDWKCDSSEAPPAKFVRERRPSSSSVGSSLATGRSQSLPKPQSVVLTPTHSEDDRKSTSSSKLAQSNEKAVAERAILALIDQVLQTSKESKSANPILNLLLSFHNARSVLFTLATKQPAIMQQLVTVMKNPNLFVPPETLAQLEKKLKSVSSECAELSIL